MPPQTKVASHGPQNLIFVNMSDPQRDSKRPENRKAIARWAMINRPGRQTSNNHNNSNTNTTNNASASANANANATTNGESSRRPPPSLPRAHSTASSSTATSPPDDTLTWRTSSGSPPTLGDFDLPYHSSDDSYFSHMTPNELNDLSQFFLQEMDIGTQFSQTLPAVTSPDTSTTETIGESSTSTETITNSQNVRPKNARSRRPTATVVNPNHQQQLVRQNRQQISRPDFQQQPLMITNGATDPFDCLPVKADAHTHELVYMYLHAQLVSKVLAKPGSQVLERLKQSRDAIWWPLTRGSKAALSALIAYVEATPEMKNKARSPSFLQKHLDVAMAAVTEALQTPGKETDDAICFAIILLMITAQRLRDTDIFRVHVSMLAQVLSQRAHAFEKNRYLENETARRGINFPSPDNGVKSNRCLYCRDIKEKAASPEAAEIVARANTEYNGSGFYNLIDIGILSQSMRDFIDQVLEWNKISEMARADRLSAAGAASHAWIDGSSRLEARTPFDTATMYAMRLCLYLSAWLDWNHSCSAVRNMLSAVHDGLQKSDIQMLLIQCPDALLWMAMLAGPYAEGDMRKYFSTLMVKAREETGLREFEPALGSISERFLWTPTMTPAAEGFFWDGMQLPDFNSGYI